MGNIRSNTISGLKWSAIERLLTQGVQLSITIFLARLLGPTSFGQVGMLAVFIALSNVFVDCGFASALIRKNDRNENDYATAFYFNLFVSIVVYFILYVSAPLIGKFYETPELIGLLRGLGIVVILNAIMLIPKVILTVRMDFKSQAKVSILSIIASGVFSIILAYLKFGTWVLIFQTLGNSLLSVVFLNLLSPWFPKARFSFVSFKYLFSFGSKLLLSGLLDTVYNNLYQVVIGKIYSVSSVGYFTQANQLASLPAMTLTNIIQRVTYPMFSLIQNDEKKFNESFRNTMKLAAVTIFPVIMCIAIISKHLFEVLLGESWKSASALLSVLCLGYMLYPIHAINLNILQVKGRSDLFLRLEIIKKIIGVLILIYTIPRGILYMCVGLTVSSYVALYVNTLYTAKLLFISQLEQIRDIFPIWCVSVIAAGIGYLSGVYFGDGVLLSLMMTMLPFLLIYSVYVFVFQRDLINMCFCINNSSRD